MISFIIPAHNEETLLGATLNAIRASARALGEAYEVIVVDDASTDATAAIARDHDARVVCVSCRQIAGARNAGANVANGDVLIFVDADTVVTRGAVSAAIGALHDGAIGGGCEVRFDGRVPGYASALQRLLPPLLRALRMAPGCFIFCTWRAYRAVGGFDETLFVTEEVGFCRRLQALGRFVMLHEFVVTSARKLRARSAIDMLRVGLRIALGGAASLRSREGLEYWYGKR